MDKVIPMQLRNGRDSQPAGSLAAAALETLGHAADYFVRDPGETMFQIGQRPSTVLILLDGSVKLSMDSEEGRTVILEIAGPEQILGLTSVVAGEPYDKTATTLTLCRFASLPISDFEGLILSSRRTLVLAISELNNAYKQACSQVQRLGEPHIPCRMARAVLEWASKGHRTERGLRFHLPLNHGEIGAYIGARRETVTRVLGDFQRRGLVEIKGALFTVLDRHGLEACAGLPDLSADELA